jgi:hypothetical protein
MPSDAEARYTSSLDLWLTRWAFIVVIALQMALINVVWFRAKWLFPTIEITMLVPLIALSARAERLARVATRSGEWKRVSRYRPLLKVLAGALVIIVSVANAFALFTIIRALVGGTTSHGRTLLLDAVNIWMTNVIIFALWYWQIDQGGPSLDRSVPHPPSDFLFPQMVAPPENPAASQHAGFVDYLFLSFTTCTAFSPTDTLPLTWRMKLLMMLEAIISLLTIAIVAARAVNILA